MTFRNSQALPLATFDHLTCEVKGHSWEERLESLHGTGGMTVWVMISDHRRWLSKDDSAAPLVKPPDLWDGVVDKDDPSSLRLAKKTEKLLATSLNIMQTADLTPLHIIFSIHISRCT